MDGSTRGTLPAGRRRRAAIAAFAVAVAASVAVLTTATTIPSAHALPDRPIAIVGDSLGVGAAPYLTAELDDLGITNRTSSVGGRRIPVSVPAPFSGVLAVRELRAAGFDPETWIVALGTNDVSSAGGQDPVALRAMIDEMRVELNSTGPKRIWWVNVSRLDVPGLAANFNAVLRDVAAIDPSFRIVDFDAWLAAGRHHLMAPDGIHMTAAGYRSRARFILIDVLREFGLRFVGGDPDLHAPFTASGSGEPLSYTPVVPARVLDTRITGPRFEPGTVYSLDLSQVVPASTEAISASVAVDGADSDGFVTAFPCSSGLPPTSSLNFTAGRARSSHVLVGLGTGRVLCLRASTRTDVIVDLQGTFAPGGAGAGLVRVDSATPRRHPGVGARADDRPDRAARRVGARAQPGGDRPRTRRVPLRPPVRPAAWHHGIAQLPRRRDDLRRGVRDGRRRRSRLRQREHADRRRHRPHGDDDPGGRRMAIPAGRAHEGPRHRDATGGWVGRTGFGSVVDVESAPPAARATSGLIALVAPAPGGFGVIFPCGAIPGTANVNAPTNGISANSFTVAGPDGRICTLTNTPADVVVDTTGWWVA